VFALVAVTSASFGLSELARAQNAAATPVPAPAPAATTSLRERDITLDAASSELDYRGNAVTFRDVNIAQGNIKVSAERAAATGLEFENATWEFTGRVRIEFDGGVLRSEAATVAFERNRITRATIRGQQAEFEQSLKDRAATARGRAGEIVYDVAAGTVVLAGAAWLSDGRSEIRGEQLVYDVRERRVQAGKPAGRDERVRITIRPKADPP
jgi:hypothetical protein